MTATYDDPGVLYDDPYVTYDGDIVVDPGTVFPGLRFELNFDTHGDSGYLIVGDPARGIVGVGIVGPDLPDSGSWYDVTLYTEELQTTRGRQRLLEQYAPGTAHAILNDTDGRFDQFNLDGPYVSGGVSQIDAMRGARLSAEYPVGSGRWTYLWWGYTDSFQPHYAPEHPTSEVQATDAFKVFNTDGPDEDIPITGGRSDLVIGGILDRIGWPSDFRNLDVGQTVIGDFTWQANTTALSVMQLVAQSEGGSFFIGPDNTATFLRRSAPYTGRSQTPQATFSNDLPPTPGGLPYFSPDPIRSDDLVKNIVSVANFQNPGSVASDATSISRYGRKKFGIANLLNLNESQNLPYAEWVVSLNATAWDRIDTLTLTPRSDVRLWPVVIGVKIKDRVRVIFRPWAGTTWTGDFFVEGIDHRILPGTDWTTTLHLLPAAPYATDLFIVGSSKVGGPDLVGLF